MFEFFRRLFEPDFLSRQRCWEGNNQLILLHNLSDAAIGFAYLAIPFALVYVVRHRPDLPFKYLFWLFGAFIVSCGLTHFADVLVTYSPIYRLTGLVKFVTAVVSWVTLLALLPVIPAALLLRSPAELEREVRKRTEELEAANAALTTEVAERQRVEAALREADRRRNEFLATLAHELRNPLSPVRNAAALLSAPGLTSDTIDRLRGMIARQVKHLARIVDDLLDVSRITHGKIELRRQRLDLSVVIREAVEDQRTAVEAGGRRLTVEVPSDPLWADADPTRLTQVVTNLLSNAAKYTDPEGAVQVRLETVDGAAELTVSDNGIGIGADILPHVFETFVQADRSLDRARGGLGLGLALVRGLAGLHGGSARAESEGLGRGSRFVVRLPLTGDQPPPEPSASPLRATPTGPARVLIIEDNLDVGESLRMLLVSRGHEARVETAGPAGLTAAAEWRPDVVLCDLGLPGMDGYAVGRALRGHPATASSFLIALSGYSDDDARRRCREVGFDAHIAKPADPELLLAALASATARGGIP